MCKFYAIAHLLVAVLTASLARCYARVAEAMFCMFHAVWWFAPFFSGGGYSSEAIDFAMALDASPFIKRDGLWIWQHGDAIKRGVLQVLL